MIKFKGGNDVKSAYTCVLDIPADIKRIRRTVERILNFINEYTDLTEESYFETKVIFNELLTNAIVHGNKQDKNKKVFIKIGICIDKWLYAIIEDQGEGITEELETSHNTISHNQEEYDDIDICSLNESGRGLIIASSLCEKMKRNKKGNKTIVLKSIE